MKGTLYGLGFTVTRCRPLGRYHGWCPMMPVTRLVSNKPVPHLPTALDGAPAIPRSGIAKRPRQGSPTAGTNR